MEHLQFSEASDVYSFGSFVAGRPHLDRLHAMSCASPLQYTHTHTPDLPSSCLRFSFLICVTLIPVIMSVSIIIIIVVVVRQHHPFIGMCVYVYAPGTGTGRDGAGTGGLGGRGGVTGIIMWEMFTRATPFTGMNPHQAALAVVAEVRPVHPFPNRLLPAGLGWWAVLFVWCVLHCAVTFSPFFLAFYACVWHVDDEPAGGRTSERTG